jgi:tripeptide aminopeptidase
MWSLKSGSTDANIPFSLGLPAVCFGIADGMDAHKPGEYLITDNMDRSMEKVAGIIAGVWDLS